MIQGNEIYTGVEAEGRLQGVPTVFSKMVDICAWEVAHFQGIGHICFGVRGHTIVKDEYDTLLRMIDEGSRHIITVHQHLEASSFIPASIWARCHVMLYQDLPEASLLGNDVEIKLENHLMAAVFSRPQMISLDYVHDKEVPNVRVQPA